MILNDLTPGDRFRAYESLWAFLYYSERFDNEIVARKIENTHPGSHSSICSFDRTEEVIFVPPIEEL